MSRKLNDKSQLWVRALQAEALNLSKLDVVDEWKEHEHWGEWEERRGQFSRAV